MSCSPMLVRHRRLLWCPFCLPRPCVLHDCANEFVIESSMDCPIDLGLVLQQVRWKHGAETVKVSGEVEGISRSVSRDRR